ncbi:MAG: hypothetical protein Q7V88_06230 [Actinomycetota bacterium]|nr:hypothetical protein [Actinomycetota bacterium]
MTLTPSVRPRVRCRSAAAAVALLLASGLAGSVAWAVAGDPIDLGEVQPVGVNDRVAIVRGRSATEFSLALPADAACPGDSLHDQWRVQSFIIPAADDPGTIKYGANGPEGLHQYALYELNTSPFTDMLTRANDQAGEPGVISDIPALSFAVFPPGTLPDGDYRIGIACTYFRETATYWDTVIVLTANPDDAPAQLTWRLADAPAIAPASDDSSGWIAPAVITAVLVVLGGLVWKVRARRRTTTSKEPR